MPDGQKPTTDEEADMLHIDLGVLRTARGLGLPKPDLEGVTTKVSEALSHEFEAEGGREAERVAERKPRHRRAILITVIMLAIGGVATAGYAALTGSSTESDGIGCYSGDEVGGNVTAVGLDGRTATETCAEVWATGGVIAGAEKAPAPLHACVSPEGGGPIRVLTSKDPSVCDEAGLVEDPTAGSDPAARRFGGFSSALSAALEREEFVCAGPGRVRVLIERLLAGHGLKGWTIVERGSFGPVDRCATVALDSDVRTATLVPGSP